MRIQKKTHIVTIAQSLSNWRKNENPVSHVKKTTPNASVKKLFHYRNMVLHTHFHLFESPKWKYENENPKKDLQFDCPHWQYGPFATDVTRTFTCFLGIFWFFCDMCQVPCRNKVPFGTWLQWKHVPNGTFYFYVKL
jgi:hypothetical protein